MTDTRLLALLVTFAHETRRALALKLALDITPKPISTKTIDGVTVLMQHFERLIAGHYPSDNRSPSGKTLCRCGELWACRYDPLATEVTSS